MPSEQISIADELRSRIGEFAEAVVDRHYLRVPDLTNRYGAIGRQRCLEDANYHLRYLAEAVEADSPVLFADYIHWASVILEVRKIPLADLARNLDCLSELLQEGFPPDQFSELARTLEVGMSQLEAASKQSTPQLQSGVNGQLAFDYLTALLDGQRRTAMALIHDAIANGMSIKDIYLNVFQPVQYEIGRLWQLNRISVAQEHFCTAVTQMVMSQLYPQIFAGIKNGRTMVCASIGDDLHELGSRMIADFFELEGWDTHFVGANTPISGVVQQVVDRKADLLGLSATMTFHLPQLRATIQAVRRVASPKIMVGGRPFNLDSSLWKQVSADGFACDASDAITVAQSLFEAGGAP